MATCIITSSYLSEQTQTKYISLKHKKPVNSFYLHFMTNIKFCVFVLANFFLIALFAFRTCINKDMQVWTASEAPNELLIGATAVRMQFTPPIYCDFIKGSYWLASEVGIHAIFIRERMHGTPAPCLRIYLGKNTTMTSTNLFKTLACFTAFQDCALWIWANLSAEGQRLGKSLSHTL